MDILGSKLVCMVLMQILTLCGGLIPLRLIPALSARDQSSSRTDFLVSLLNCFAGGVFLGTTLLHLFPEVSEQIEGILEANNLETDFPVAEFIISIGFFVIMLMEHLIMSLQHSHGGLSLDSFPASPTGVEEKEPLLQDSGRYGSLSDTQKQQTSPAAATAQPVKDPEGHDCQRTLLADIQQREDNCVHIIHPSHHQKHHKPSKIPGLRAVMLLLALSLHTIFEGLAIGLQSTTQNVWTLFVAVSIHKVIIAFTLGVQFMSALDSHCRVVVFMVLFSLMSPLGVGVGTAVTASQATDAAVQMASGILQGIATGTFVYVTFFEVLQKEVGQDHSLLKVLLVIIGYSLVTVINLFSPA